MDMDVKAPYRIISSFEKYKNLRLRLTELNPPEVNLEEKVVQQSFSSQTLIKCFDQFSISSSSENSDAEESSKFTSKQEAVANHFKEIRRSKNKEELSRNYKEKVQYSKPIIKTGITNNNGIKYLNLPSKNDTFSFIVKQPQNKYDNFSADTDKFKIIKSEKGPSNLTKTVNKREVYDQDVHQKEFSNIVMQRPSNLSKRINEQEVHNQDVYQKEISNTGVQRPLNITKDTSDREVRNQYVHPRELSCRGFQKRLIRIKNSVK